MERSAIRGVFPRIICPGFRCAPSGLRPSLKQTQLLAVALRLGKMVRGQLGAPLVQSELFAGDLEAAADHPGHRAGALHPRAPLRVVVTAAAHVADQGEDMAIAVGIVRHQPFAEQIAHFQRQPQQHVARFLVAGMPASANCRNASSRFGGVEARGSMVRASFGSSVVTDSATLARLRFAIRAKMSMSRVTSADFVTMPTGWLVRSSTSRMPRMIFRSRSIG